MWNGNTGWIQDLTVAENLKCKSLEMWKREFIEMWANRVSAVTDGAWREG